MTVDADAMSCTGCTMPRWLASRPAVSPVRRCVAGAPRVFVETQGTFTNSFDVDNSTNWTRVARLENTPADAEGRYTLTDVRAGGHRVAFSRDYTRYLPENYGGGGYPAPPGVTWASRYSQPV